MMDHQYREGWARDLSTKAAFSTALKPPVPPIVYLPEFYMEPYNIRAQLFAIDPAGRMFPRYPPLPEIHKEVISTYVAHHRIPKERMLDFWSEYVDCLICCHNFEEETPPHFRAWAYGRLCRYYLLERSRRAVAYDPENNYSLQ